MSVISLKFPEINREVDFTCGVSYTTPGAGCHIGTVSLLRMYFPENDSTGCNKVIVRKLKEDDKPKISWTRDDYGYYRISKEEHKFIMDYCTEHFKDKSIDEYF